MTEYIKKATGERMTVELAKLVYGSEMENNVQVRFRHQNGYVPERTPDIELTREGANALVQELVRSGMIDPPVVMMASFPNADLPVGVSLTEAHAREMAQSTTRESVREVAGEAADPIDLSLVTFTNHGKVNGVITVRDFRQEPITLGGATFPNVVSLEAVRDAIDNYLESQE